MRSQPICGIPQRPNKLALRGVIITASRPQNKASCTNGCNVVANKGQQLGKPVLGECVSFEPNGAIRLWTGAGEGDRVVLPFVNAFDKAFIVLVLECERFCRSNDKP